MRPKQASLITAPLLAAVLTAGCGSVASTTAAAGSPSSADLAPSPPVATASACTFGATGADVEVQFADDAAPCSIQEQNLASFGLSWYPLDGLIQAGYPGPADGETEGTACVLTKDGSTMTVMDAGGMSYGTQICSSEEQGGWTNTNN